MQSAEQTAALQRVWVAAQGGYGVHLTPEETRLVWDRILRDTRAIIEAEREAERALA